MLNIDEFMGRLEQRHPGEKEFLQAVREVLISVKDVYDQHPEFERKALLERLVEPERIITSVTAYSSTAPLVLTRAVCVSTHLSTSPSSNS